MRFPQEDCHPGSGEENSWFHHETAVLGYPEKMRHLPSLLRHGIQPERRSAWLFLARTWLYCIASFPSNIILPLKG
jgi:hypothetical protein